MGTAGEDKNILEKRNKSCQINNPKCEDGSPLRRAPVAGGRERGIAVEWKGAEGWDGLSEGS